jgi:ABC-type transport system involved in multi-copper enzyme maturation permease subunit
METIYDTTLGILATSLLFVGLFMFEPYNKLTAKYLDFKPFNCLFCFSFWGSILVLMYLGISPLYAIICAFIAELTFRKII